MAATPATTVSHSSGDRWRWPGRRGTVGPLGCRCRSAARRARRLLGSVYRSWRSRPLLRSPDGRHRRVHPVRGRLPASPAEPALRRGPVRPFSWGPLRPPRSTTDETVSQLCYPPVDGRPDTDHQRARPRRLPADRAAPLAGRRDRRPAGALHRGRAGRRGPAAAARCRARDRVPDAGGARGARRRRAARPAERRARLRRLRAGAPPPRGLLPLRAHERDRRRRPALGRPRRRAADRLSGRRAPARAVRAVPGLPRGGSEPSTEASGAADRAARLGGGVHLGVRRRDARAARRAPGRDDHRARRRDPDRGRLLRPDPGGDGAARWRARPGHARDRVRLPGLLRDREADRRPRRARGGRRARPRRRGSIATSGSSARPG